MQIYPKCFAHNFGPVGSAIYCNCGNKLFRAIAMNEINTQQVSIVIDQDGKARCFGQSAPQRIEAYSRVDRFRHAKPQEEDAIEANYWIVYAIAITDSTGCAAATEIWVTGESGNKRLKRYPATHEPTPIRPFYYINPDTTETEPINGSIQNSDFESTPEFEETWTISEVDSTVNYDVILNQVNDATSIPFVRLWDSFTLHQYKVDLSGILNLSKTASAAVMSVQRGGGDTLASVAIEEDNSGSTTFNYSNCVDTSIAVTFSVIANASGIPGTSTGSASFSGTKALYLYPEVLYAATENNTLYTAVRYIRNENDIAIDYFENDRLIATFDAATPITATDWRASLLIFDLGAFIPPSSGDSCIDAYREDNLTNLYEGTLRTVVGNLEILKTQSAAIAVTVQSATSNGSCTLGEAINTTRRAVKLSTPVLNEGETAATTIIWAAP